LLNAGPAPVAFQQYFFAADGKAAAFTIRTQSETLKSTAIQGMLTPGSTSNLTVSDSATTAREGWSLLSFDAQASLQGYAIIRHTGLAGVSFEAAVPLSGMQDCSLYMPFDNTQGFRTHLTLVNPAANLAAQIRLTYLNPRGQVTLVDSLTLQPAQQMTLVLPDTYPDIANKTGTVLLEADIDRLSVTGLRYNELYGAIAALPILIGSDLPR
jgi:hypothetical protein